MKNGILTQIVIGFLFIFLIIALMLYLSGFKGPIQFDSTYYDFMKRVALEYQSWNISIPNIPTIPTGDIDNNVVTFLANFVNFLVTVLNVLILILNKIIELVLFVVALIKQLVSFKDDLSSQSNYSGDIEYWWSSSLTSIS